MKQNEMRHFQEATRYSEKSYFVAIFHYTDKGHNCLWKWQDNFFLLFVSIIKKYLNPNSITSELSLLFLPKSVIPKAFFFLYGASQNGELPGKSSRKITCRKVRFRPINYVLAAPEILSLEIPRYFMRWFRTAARILIFPLLAVLGVK